MSVRGEFQRCLGDCLAFLEASAPAGAERWRVALRRAGALAESDLSQGAAQVLEETAQRSDEPPAFRSPLERERFGALLEHLAGVCRVILGR